jgi:hypothetical protein
MLLLEIGRGKKVKYENWFSSTASNGGLKNRKMMEKWEY